MDEEQIKKIIEDTYDESKEDSIMSMARDFYSRKIETQLQIMYAAIFVPCVLGIGFMKVFAWEMIHRNSIKREIKRLELRIAELSQIIKNK